MSLASNGPSAKYLGVTPPISLAGPTEADLRLTAELEAHLQASGFFESDEEGVQREVVLGRLSGIVRDFVRAVARQKHLPPSIADDVNGKIYTFGSYRLGVHSKGADIDTLCVAPQHVDRGDFFTTLHGMLQALPEVGELAPVPDAYVPVMKFKFAGISIDLVFARISLVTIPEDLDLLDTNLLRHMDEKCILSLNGSRTTDQMLKLVPNIATFHVALRAVKLWAKRRGMYSNVMGYVAGVALALLTARICQLYPNAAPSTVVTRLFKIYHQWQWPQPVYLKTIEDLPLQMKVWNPRIHAADRYHRMPVITPAYPSMCATHNVTASTLRLMTEEFGRAADAMVRIEQRKATFGDDLFCRTDFFVRYRNFFQIIAIAESEEAFLIWSGFLGSKVRHLTPKLEAEEAIHAAPPYHEGFSLVVAGEDLDDVRRVHFYTEASDQDAALQREGEGRGGNEGGVGAENETAIPPREDGSIIDKKRALAELSSPSVQLPEATSSNEEEAAQPSAKTTAPSKKFYTMAYYVAIVISPPSAAAVSSGPRRICLDGPVNDFKTFVACYDRLTPDMHVIIRDIKRDNLPSYVFEDGKRPPPRAAGGKKARAVPRGDAAALSPEPDSKLATPEAGSASDAPNKLLATAPLSPPPADQGASPKRVRTHLSDVSRNATISLSDAALDGDHGPGGGLAQGTALPPHLSSTSAPASQCS